MKKKNLKTSEEIDSERKIILQITEKLSNKKKSKKEKKIFDLRSRPIEKLTKNSILQKKEIEPIKFRMKTDKVFL